MKNHGSDFLLGDLVKPKAEKKLQRAAEPLAIDDAVDFLESGAADTKKLVGGLKAAVSALDAIRASGLTGEALIVLVQAKCKSDAKGNETSRPQVERVLEGLFRLGEYVR